MRLDRRSLINLLLTGLILLVVAWGAWQGQRLMRGDFTSIQARYRIDGWMAGKAKWSIAEWIQARDDLLAAVDITPDNPMLHDYLGILNTLRGQRAWSDEGLRKRYFSEAMVFQQASLRLRPQNGAAWANLALSQRVLGDHAGASAALEQALRYSPNELGVKKLSAELVLVMWPDMSPGLQAWLRSLYRTAPLWEQQELLKLATAHGRADVLK